MNNNIKKIINTPLYIISCILTIILGVFLHFTYDFLNRPFLIGLFVPINESIWEHLKLVVIPITIFSIIYSIIYKRSNYKLNSFWYYSTISIVISLIVIPTIHYTYEFIFKNVPSAFDISLYIISMIISFVFIYIKMKKQYQKVSMINKNRVGIILLIFIYILFIIFTIYPPKCELFKDPINNTYGIFLL